MRRLLLIPFLACLSLACLPPPVQAGSMGAAEFERYTQGRTLFYAQDGETYGAERYLPGRRVVWSFLDGKCKEGRWYEEAGLICFIYEDQAGPQCWSFSRGASGLIAEFADGGAPALYEAEDTGAEMICLGPEIGV